MESLNKKTSWLINPNKDLSSPIFLFFIFSESILITPLSIEKNFNNKSIIVVFPHPDSPTIAIFSPFFIDNERLSIIL